MTHYLKFGCYATSWKSVPPAEGSPSARRVWYFDNVSIGDADSLLVDFKKPERLRSVFKPFPAAWCP
jgi:hypothetical protein